MKLALDKYTQQQNGSASDRFQLARCEIVVEIDRWRSRSVVECELTDG